MNRVTFTTIHFRPINYDNASSVGSLVPTISGHMVSTYDECSSSQPQQQQQQQQQQQHGILCELNCIIFIYKYFVGLRGNGDILNITPQFLRDNYGCKTLFFTDTIEESERQCAAFKALCPERNACVINSDVP
jgi:hypothetical protein